MARDCNSLNFLANHAALNVFHARTDHIHGRISTSTKLLQGRDYTLVSPRQIGTNFIDNVHDRAN